MSEDRPPFADFRLDTAPGHLLRRCHQRSQELFNRVTEVFDLTRQQFAFMLTLYQSPGSSVQELAELTGVDRNTLAGIISRLSAKGLVCKTRSQRDARAYELELTPAGRDLVGQMEAPIREVQERILSPLDAREREQFIRLAQKLSGLGKGK